MDVAVATDRFWSRVARRGPDDCWLWIGATNNGYGQISVGSRDHRRRVYAHHFALELTLGRPLAPGKIACHHCDNPPCVNPAHLYEGTNQTNHDDMVARGRKRGGWVLGGKRPDTRIRLIRRGQEQSGLTHLDDVDWTWWRDEDAASARSEVAALVERVERGDVTGKWRPMWVTA